MSNDYKSAVIRAQIDADLRRAYQETLNEELPKRFVDLLDKLRKDGQANAESAPKGARLS